MGSGIHEYTLSYVPGFTVFLQAGPDYVNFEKEILVAQPSARPIA
jgi:hypothetical protein